MGRVSMDLTTFDVTDVPQARPGDRDVGVVRLARQVDRRVVQRDRAVAGGPAADAQQDALERGLVRDGQFAVAAEPHDGEAGGAVDVQHGARAAEACRALAAGLALVGSTHAQDAGAEGGAAGHRQRADAARVRTDAGLGQRADIDQALKASQGG